MLAPALSESALRWEELGSGFSGHGFDDRQPEHYAPPDLANAPVLDERQKGWLMDWARQQRRNMVEQTSERLKGVRSRWFGWRLRMKEIEHPEEPVKEDRTITKQELAERQRRELGDAAAMKEKESPVQTQQAVTKRRSWVWEWSRNNKP
jgi:hypothetical protein